MIDSKCCPRCGKTKPLSEFGKSKQTKDGKNCWCLQCCREVAKTYRETTVGIYQNIKGRVKYYKDRHDKRYKPLNLSRDDFVEWYNSQERVCGYCDIPEEALYVWRRKFNGRIRKLEVDCMNNDLGYVDENLVLACHQCNFLKGNLLSFDEMREFAQKYLKPRWLEKVKNRPTIKEEET